MIAVSNSAVVVLGVGAAMTFDAIIWKSGCSETFRDLSTAIRVGTGVYEVSFNGNVSGAVADTQISLAIAANGTVLPETAMISTPGSTAALNNVSAMTWIGNQPSCNNPCPGSLSISVVNTGAAAVTVNPNAKLSVKRIG